MYIIKSFLDKDEIKVILDNLKDWKDGYTNANKEHKDNFELVQEQFGKLIAQKIKEHEISINTLFIRKMTLPRFNKYTKGQKYARHIDAFIQQGVQTDWSYTLMLKPAEIGGYLEVENGGQQTQVELGAGDIVFYNSGKIHQVTPVEEGERIAVIGWIESLITRDDQREILSNIVSVFQELDRREEKDLVLKLSSSYHNLLRIWNKNA